MTTPDTDTTSVRTPLRKLLGDKTGKALAKHLELHTAR